MKLGIRRPYLSGDRFLISLAGWPTCKHNILGWARLPTKDLVIVFWPFRIFIHNETEKVRTDRMLEALEGHRIRRLLEGNGEHPPSGDLPRNP